MSVRTRACKSRYKASQGYVKDKSWKTSLPKYYAEQTTISASGNVYTKLVPAHKLEEKPRIIHNDLVAYLNRFFGGLF